MANEQTNVEQPTQQPARFQFSLRGLLAFVTLFATSLGLAFHAPDAVVVVVVPLLLIGVLLGCAWFVLRGRAQGYRRAFAFGAASFTCLLVVGWYAAKTWIYEWAIPGPAELDRVTTISSFHNRLFADMCRITVLLLFFAVSAGGAIGAGILWLRRRADEALENSRRGHNDRWGLAARSSQLDPSHPAAMDTAPCRLAYFEGAPPGIPPDPAETSS